jgi:hypothetical protein
MQDENCYGTEHQLAVKDDKGCRTYPLKPAIEQPVIKEQAPLPATLLAPAPRAAVAKALPHPLAVDLQEACLFYRSLQGKLVSRAIASGAVEWESQEFGYPLRVTDQIL